MKYSNVFVPDNKTISDLVIKSKNEEKNDTELYDLEIFVKDNGMGIKKEDQ
jgi:hypothetical protein